MDNDKNKNITEGLREILLKFTITCLLEQPEDLVDFAVDFFTKMKNSRVTSIESAKPADEW